MNHVARSFAIVLAGLAAATAGCKPTASDPAPAMPPQDAPQTAPASEPAAPEHDVVAPLVVTLDVQPGPQPSTYALNVRVDVRAPLPFRPVMRVALPSDATPIAGKLEEVLDASVAGATMHPVLFAAARPPSIELPIRVVVDGQAPGGALGLHAERQFPERPAMRVIPRGGPIVPGGRPPGPSTR